MGSVKNTGEQKYIIFLWMGVLIKSKYIGIGSNT